MRLKWQFLKTRFVELYNSLKKCLGGSLYSKKSLKKWPYSLIETIFSILTDFSGDQVCEFRVEIVTRKLFKYKNELYWSLGVPDAYIRLPTVLELNSTYTVHRQLNKKRPIVWKYLRSPKMSQVHFILSAVLWSGFEKITKPFFNWR